MSKFIRSTLILFVTAGITACASAGTTTLPDDGGAGSADQTVSTSERWPIRTREHLDTWLHGYGEQAIVAIINNGKTSDMPGQAGQLSEAQIHVLTGYVWGLSNTAPLARP